MKHSHRTKRKVWRSASFESLEMRCLLDGQGALLGSDAYLTLSFAPDGAQVAGQSNSLAARFNAIAPEAVWKEAILRSFQTWAVEANIDIGLVSDSGDAFGTPGPTRRDARFGDIRIGAIELEPQVGAISVPIDNVLGGTWYADVLFNADFPYQTVNDIFAIALHEAGNVFGLKDNNDPASPMRAGPIPTATVPTPADIAALRALHGIRSPDANELNSDNSPNPNNEPNLATPLAFGDDDPSTATLAYGDITNNADIDYYVIQTPDDHQGDLTFRVRSAGVSLLKPTVTVLDQSENVLASGVANQFGGGLVSLTLPNAEGDTSYLVRVTGAEAGPFGVGGYSLVVTLDDINTIPQSEIDAAADGSLRRVDPLDLQNVFAGLDFYGDEPGINETPAEATELIPTFGFSGARFEVVGSIARAGDLDFYRLTVPDLGGPATLYASVRSMDAGRLIPGVTVLDAAFQPVPFRVLVNGAGEYLVEVDGLAANADVYLSVGASESAGPFTTGNYVLTGGVSLLPVELQTLATGVLASVGQRAEHNFYVAEPQLFHFVLGAQSPPQAPAAVVVEIVDSSGVVRLTVAAPVGQARSTGAVLLPTGSYTARVFARQLGGSPLREFGYQLSGRALSDPFVGNPGDPTTNPFACDPEIAGFFCYPGDIVSPDPYYWSDFVASLSAPPPDLPLTDLVQLLLGDWWDWVWSTNGVNGPPLAVDDQVGTLGNGAGVTLTAPISVLTNDFEPERDPFVAILTTQPAGGVVTLNPDGSFTYQPRPGFSGPDSFTYVGYDFRQQSAPATVSVVAPPTQSLVGDFDGNGAVNSSDYAFYRSHFGATSGPGLAADANSNGMVDAADYTVWRDNLGAVAPASAAVSLGVASPGVSVLGDPPSVARSSEVPQAATEAVPPIDLLLPLRGGASSVARASLVKDLPLPAAAVDSALLRWASEPGRRVRPLRLPVPADVAAVSPKRDATPRPVVEDLPIFLAVRLQRLDSPF